MWIYLKGKSQVDRGESTTRQLKPKLIVSLVPIPSQST